MEHNLVHHKMAPATEAPLSMQFSQYDYGMEQETHHHLRDYFNTVMVRKWWFIGVFLAIVTLGGIYTYMQTTLYQATAILQITQDNSSAIIGPRDPINFMDFDSANRFYETQYNILNSPAIAQKIVRSLNLKEHPLFKKGLEGKPPNLLRTDEEYLADQVRGSLSVKPIKNSFLVEVSYLSPDRGMAQRIANDIYNEYTEFAMETRQQSYNLIKNWLQRELQKLATNVEASERKLYDYGRTKDFVALEGSNDVVFQKYIELNKVLTSAESERAIKEAQYRQIAQKGTEAPIIRSDSLIQRLRGEVITQEAKVSSIGKIFGKNYPQLQAEMAKLNDLRGRLNTEVKRAELSIKADYEVALRAEKLLREETSNQKKNVMSLQNNLIEHHILQRDMQTNQQLYEALLSRMKEASIGSTMVSSNASVIQPAQLPERPAKPNKVKNMAMAIFIGLMGGIGAAFLVDYFDDSLKTTGEVERVCRFPVLGVVPLISFKDRDLQNITSVGLATFSKPKSMISEAIHHVLTSTMLSLSERPPAVIMVTSPNPNDGKTTLAINLASALAANGHNVLVIDNDMRKPSIHGIFGATQQPGLSNYLAGSAGLADIIQSTQIPNLFLIAAGTVPPNPVQLINSQAYTDLIKNLRHDFQHVIIDTPPIIGFTDGRAISAVVDGVLLVVKHQQTSREAGRLAIKLLTQINGNILGIVLNMAQSNKLGYGGYYGYYKYYSQYYKQYQDIDKIES